MLSGKAALVWVYCFEAGVVVAATAWRGARAVRVAEALCSVLALYNVCQWVPCVFYWWKTNVKSRALLAGRFGKTLTRWIRRRPAKGRWSSAGMSVTTPFCWTFGFLESAAQKCAVSCGNVEWKHRY